MVAVNVKTIKDGFTGTFHWLSPPGQAMLEETRTMTFDGDARLRIVDVEIALKALIDTKFGGQQETVPFVSAWPNRSPKKTAAS